MNARYAIWTFERSWTLTPCSSLLRSSCAKRQSQTTHHHSDSFRSLATRQIVWSIIDSFSMPHYVITCLMYAFMLGCLDMTCDFLAVRPTWDSTCFAIVPVPAFIHWTGKCKSKTATLSMYIKINGWNGHLFWLRSSWITMITWEQCRVQARTLFIAETRISLVARKRKLTFWLTPGFRFEVRLIIVFALLDHCFRSLAFSYLTSCKHMTHRL
jgi:hypothetical protein